ncbi:hypothetical protein HK100_002874 [Physocladia obscura]|uniref:Glycoside hydrolase family 5 C-terminal domain-containing protein n=1 Tax=Physocladia obscura TaxID=109957 RepID=A0AAD5SXN4_9FUNG|nr:hypothetical protein HK100_002874 [Physocladia obscura]
MGAMYSRTYASAIAGTPTYMNYDDDSGEFTLVFLYNNGGSGKTNYFATAHVTEIRTNFKLHYPSGHRVEVSVAGETNGKVMVVAVDEIAGSLQISPDQTRGDGQVKSGDEVIVKIFRV